MSVATVEAPRRPRATVQPGTRRLVQLALLLAPVVFLVAIGFARRWVEEDAFLNFRIVDQIRAGHGPVFNVGERVARRGDPLAPLIGRPQRLPTF